MRWLGNLAPWLVLIAYQVGLRLTGCHLPATRLLALIMAGAAAAIVWRRKSLGKASDLEIGVVAYLALAALGFWLFPGSLGLLMTGHSSTALYGILFITATAPPVFGRESFTCHFARQTAPLLSGRPTCSKKSTGISPCSGLPCLPGAPLSAWPRSFCRPCHHLAGGRFALGGCPCCNSGAWGCRLPHGIPPTVNVGWVFWRNQPRRYQNLHPWRENHRTQQNVNQYKRRKETCLHLIKSQW